MQKIASKLEHALEKGAMFIRDNSDDSLTLKPSPDKWSKKEILGHLVDSGINNLQRFTEIQFEDKPYKVRTYNQDALVRANGYQKASVLEILDCWLSINQRIASLIRWQDNDTLAYEVILSDGERADLEFLIKDYVNHLEHHLNQIIG